MKLGQGNIFRSVCQEFCSPVSAPLHAEIHLLDQRQVPPPLGADPPGPEAGTPYGSRQLPWDQRQAPPEQTHTPLEQTHPPPEQTPPSAVHAGRYRQQAGGRYPTGMQSCFNIFSVKFKLFQSWKYHRPPSGEHAQPSTGGMFVHVQNSQSKQFISRRKFWTKHV